MANDKGILIVTSAGNDALNLNDTYSDSIGYWPASYGKTKENVIVVASHDSSQTEISEYSNFGNTVIDIATYGDHILAASAETGSLFPTSGTSISTGIISGAILKIWSSDTTLKHLQVKELLLRDSLYSFTLQNLTSKINQGRILNVKAEYKCSIDRSDSIVNAKPDSIRLDYLQDSAWLNPLANDISDSSVLTILEPFG